MLAFIAKIWYQENRCFNMSLMRQQESCVQILSPNPRKDMPVTHAKVGQIHSCASQIDMRGEVKQDGSSRMRWRLKCTCFLQSLTGEVQGVASLG